MRAALLSFLMTVNAIASAETSATVNQYLNSILAISRQQCDGFDTAPIRQAETAGKELEAHSLKAGYKAICECMPTRMRELQSSLSKEKLQEVMSESRFAQELYKPRVISSCAAEQFRSTYGDGCSSRMASEIKNSAAYCSCMSKALQKFTDDELAELGLETADYVPAAANAKKQGIAPPNQPPLLSRFSSEHSVCSRE